MKFRVNFYHLFSAIVIILSSWTIYYTLPGSGSIYLFILALWILWREKFRLTKTNLFYVLTYGVLIFWNFLPRGTSIYEPGLLASIAFTAVLPALFILNNHDREKMYNYFKTILAVTLGIGLFFHIFQLAGIPLLKPLSSNYITTSGRPFVVYLTHSNNIFNGSEIIRFSSIFDEPGYLGTIIALTLSIERYNLSKLQNKILFLGGIFSLSGAFYGLTIVFYFFNAINIKKFHAVVYTIIFTALLIIITSWVFPEIFTELTDRLIFEPGSGLQDSRANFNFFIYLVEQISRLDTTTFLFGNGRLADPADYGIFIGHVSWFHLIVRIGFIFFFYMIILLLVTSLKVKSYYTTIFMLLFILSMNHRPQIFNLIYFFLLSCAIFIIPAREKVIGKGNSRF